MKKDPLMDLIASAYPEPIRLDDAARQLNKSTRTLRRWVKSAAECGLGVEVRRGALRVTNCLFPKADSISAGEPPPPSSVFESVLMSIVKELSVARGGRMHKDDLIASVADWRGVDQSEVNVALTALVQQGLVEVIGGDVTPRLVLTEGSALDEDEEYRLLALVRTERELGRVDHLLTAAEGKLTDGLDKMRKARARRQIEARRWVRYVKGRPRARYGQFLKQAAVVDDCIARHHRVHVSYRTRQNEDQEKIVSPLGTVYYWVQDDWYLVALDEHGSLCLFRGERIRNMGETWLTFAYPDDFSLEKCFAEPWGVEMADEVYDVEIVFFNHFRVIDKVRAQVAHRATARITEFDDKSVVLRDRVRGLTEIRAWMRQFGSSAMALKPEALRTEMARSAKKLHEKYSREVSDDVAARVEAAEWRCPAMSMSALFALKEPVRPMTIQRICLLGQLLSDAGPAGLTERRIAAELGVPPSQVGWYMDVLDSMGFIVKNDDTEDCDSWDQDDADEPTARPDRVWQIDDCGGDHRLPVVFTPQEASALLAAMDRAPGGDTVLASAREKLSTCLAQSHDEVAAGKADTAGAGADTGTAGGAGRWRLEKGMPALYDDVRAEAMVARLEESALRGQPVEFDYCPVGRVIVAPLCLAFYGDRGDWYLCGRPIFGQHMSSQNHVYRLDQIDGLTVRSDEMFDYPADFSAEDLLGAPWGMATGTKPIKVLVHFENEFRVADKVRSVAAHRRSARIATLDDDSVLYSDEVAGTDEFRAWIRSFGSCAEILDPPELRQEQKEGIERLVKLYGAE